MHANVAPEILAQIEELTEISYCGCGFDPLDGIVDPDKVAALAASMRENGWCGAPIVVHGEQALTGTHRYWAARETDTDIPRIQIEDVCDICDVDWAAHCEWWTTRYDCYVRIAEELPREVVEYLGLDLH
ncbi:ParB N-terminal domain-containing protein [Nocardia paucivorans]|uniref:ParB N-terminal domain-containing protein n=1 Tax=Nocardia paucivorans TaxID=114259 RepID=UPI0002D4B3EA|nr:ParB N-terminal domain-containing protein [Nocardia paucivorans]